MPAGGAFSELPTAATKKPLQCPGQLEMQQQNSTRFIEPYVFDGFKFEMSKPLTPNFIMAHSLHLGSQQAQEQFNYQIGPTMYTEQGKRVLLARIAPSGRMTGQYHETWSPKWKTKLQAHLDNDPDQSQMIADVEHTGSKSATQLRLMRGSVVQLSHNESVHPNVVVGMEMMSSFGMRDMAARRFFASYRDDGCQLHLSGGNVGALEALYTRSASKRATMATQLTYNTEQKQALCKVGYEFNLRTSRICGSIDTTGRILSTMECRVPPSPVTVLFAAEMAALRNEYRFGVGVQIGQG